MRFRRKKYNKKDIIDAIKEIENSDISFQGASYKYNVSIGCLKYHFYNKSSKIDHNINDKEDNIKKNIITDVNINNDKPEIFAGKEITTKKINILLDESSDESIISEDNNDDDLKFNNIFDDKKGIFKYISNIST